MSLDLLKSRKQAFTGINHEFITPLKQSIQNYGASKLFYLFTYRQSYHVQSQHVSISLMTQLVY